MSRQEPNLGLDSMARSFISGGWRGGGGGLGFVSPPRPEATDTLDASIERAAARQGSSDQGGQRHGGSGCYREGREKILAGWHLNPLLPRTSSAASRAILVLPLINGFGRR